MQSIISVAMNISEQRKENEIWLSNVSENIGLCTTHAQIEMSAALDQAVATEVDLSHTQVQSNGGIKRKMFRQPTYKEWKQRKIGKQTAGEVCRGLLLEIVEMCHTHIEKGNQTAGESTGTPGELCHTQSQNMLLDQKRNSQSFKYPPTTKIRSKNENICKEKDQPNSQAILFPIFRFPKATLSCDKLTDRTPDRKKDKPDRSKVKTRTLERIKSEKRKCDSTTNSHGKRTKTILQYFMTKEIAESESQTSPFKNQEAPSVRIHS